MNRDEKAAAITEIATDIEASDAIFAVDYRGISVAQAAELRTQLRAADTRFRVVKNTLTERAADQAGAPAIKALLEGPTALAFVRGDAAAAAKAIADYARATDLLPFKGGVVDGDALEPAEILAISRLPSRQVLYGQLVGVVASPITGLARTLNALVGGLAVQLGQIAEQGLVGGGASAEPDPPVVDVPTEAGVEPTDADQDAEPPVPPETTDAPAEGADDASTPSTEEQ